MTFRLYLPIHRVTRGARPVSTFGPCLTRPTFISRLVATGTTARLTLGGEHFLVTFVPHVVDRAFPAGTPVYAMLHGNGTLLVHGTEGEDVA